ncbi:dihydroneopterin aldolase family protein [Methanobrevibacter sp. DSM 116169]|uniref:dihydroneopterin aldolase family protein n=1 Tax=Methanobrevibacter sp. DSM 116169 TaxID=3242727 RepID=UPI0038FCDB84
MNVNEKYFSNINLRERAIFEGGISMGALFHQFIGTPINESSKKSLEDSIEKSLSLQPAVENVEVQIDLGNNTTEFEYVSLSGEMLNVLIETKVEDVRAKIRMKFIKELNYPLMYVEEINTKY